MNSIVRSPFHEGASGRPHKPDSKITSPKAGVNTALGCTNEACSPKMLMKVYHLDAIQHFVVPARIPSIHWGEQTLNPPESAIRRRFVRKLFREPAKDL
jgi:hypothetical protein